MASGNSATPVSDATRRVLETIGPTTPEGRVLSRSELVDTIHDGSVRIHVESNDLQPSILPGPSNRPGSGFRGDAANQATSSRRNRPAQTLPPSTSQAQNQAAAPPPQVTITRSGRRSIPVIPDSSHTATSSDLSRPSAVTAPSQAPTLFPATRPSRTPTTFNTTTASNATGSSNTTAPAATTVPTPLHAPGPSTTTSAVIPPTGGAVAVRTAGEVFTTAHVNRHPNENFMHQGKGKWIKYANGFPDVRTLKILKPGVRGPGMNAFKAAAAVEYQRRKAAGLNPDGSSRLPSGTTDGADNGGGNEDDGGDVEQDNSDGDEEDEGVDGDGDDVQE